MSKVSCLTLKQDFDRSSIPLLNLCMPGKSRILFVVIGVFSLLLDASAECLSVVPASVDFGSFPAWEERSHAVAVRNLQEKPVSLQGVRSSCNCMLADFRPCMLSPGQEASFTVTLPANSVSGAFVRTIYLETDAPGQEFLAVSVLGTAVPVVEVLPKPEVYIGRLGAGKAQSFLFRLVPASPDMVLRLLPTEDGDGVAESVLLRKEDSDAYTLEVRFTPEGSRRYAVIRRRIAIGWEREVPPITVSVMFTVDAEQPQ